MFFLINLINDDGFVSAAMPNAFSMVHLIYLLMKTYLLVLLQDNCLDLVRCAFLHKSSDGVRSITVLSTCTEARPISPTLANTNISVKPKYRSG